MSRYEGLIEILLEIRGWIYLIYPFIFDYHRAIALIRDLTFSYSPVRQPRRSIGVVKPMKWPSKIVVISLIILLRPITPPTPPLIWITEGISPIVIPLLIVTIKPLVVRPIPLTVLV